MLPLPQSLVDPESLSHTAFATMVALVFALLYAHLKPFASDELDTFANIMQAVLFLNLFVVLVMNSDNSAEQAKMRTGISHARLHARGRGNRRAHRGPPLHPRRAGLGRPLRGVPLGAQDVCLISHFTMGRFGAR